MTNPNMTNFQKRQDLHLSRKQRVLVVEDDVTFEAIWKNIIGLADKDAHVDWTTSVSEATEMIENAKRLSKPYDLIISDIFLSGSKTGIDLWRQYQDLFNEKFILVSGASHMKIIKTLKEQGQKQPFYLQKPIIIHNAVETVFELLHQPTG